MTKRKIDWSAIEQEYRTGQLSIRQIGRTYDVSEAAVRKRAKSEGWQRDLSEAVRREVRNQLVRSEVRTPHAREDGEPLDEEDEKAVETAAARAVDVITRHRTAIGKQAQIVELATDLLYQIMTNQLQPEDVVVYKNGKPTGETKKGWPKLTHILGPFDTVPEACSKLAQATSRLVAMERQAYGLDEQGGTDEDFVPLEERLKRYNAETKEQAIEHGANVVRGEFGG